MVCEYDYTADKVINLNGSEVNIHRPRSNKRYSLEMSYLPEVAHVWNDFFADFIVLLRFLCYICTNTESHKQ